MEKPDLRTLVRPNHLVADVDEELDFHLRGRVDELRAAGWTPADAHAEALRQFGDHVRYRQECRHIAERRIVRQRRGEWMGNLAQDVRFAFRGFRRSPWFAAVAVLTLALGIGATTAVFTVAKNVMLDPLPFESPDELVMVYERNEAQGIERELPSPGNFADWLRANRSLDDVAAMSDGSATLSGLGQPRVVQLAYVTPNTFSVLGVEAELGRTFGPTDQATPDEDVMAGASSALISHRLWQDGFGGDPAVVGRTMLLNDVPVAVLGVMPPTFNVPRPDIDIWYPVDYTSPTYAESRQSRYLRVFGRLAPGITVADATADLDRVQRSIAEIAPEANAGWSVSIVPVHEEVVGASARRVLVLLLGAVGFVLLIACANVASLQLGRSTTREREIGVRTALGATRPRIVRQLLTESVVLALVGCAAGTAVAYGAVDVLLALEPRVLPRIEEVGLDAGSVAFAVGAALVTAVLFGLAPAAHAVRRSVAATLSGALAVGGGSSARARSVLVVLEVAVSVMLLIGAGLLTRSLLTLRAVDPGFDIERVTIARVSLGREDYPTRASQVGYFEDILARLRETPGVVEAGVTSVLPMDPAGIDFNLPYRAEGHPDLPEADLPQSDYRVVSDGYFEALGMEIVRGRPFGSFDRSETRRVIVVNEELADRLWPGEDPIGKTITIYYVQNTTWEVVGVVENNRHRGLGAPEPAQMFVPLSQAEALFGYMHFAVKTADGSAATVQAIRTAGTQVDPKYPLYEVSPLASLITATTESDRFVATLLAAFALLALGLAAVGVHGVVAYQVRLRTREIGLRMALGADGRRLLVAVLGRVAILAAAGVALGFVGAAGTTRLVRSFLYEISPLDPLTFGGVGLVLILVACSAALLPALRAATMDPAGALRQD